MTTTDKLLARLTGPADLRDLDHDQLTQLAGEIRAFLVDVISRTGGHLSPNLGVVELTLALHRVFDSPTDRIIWDVGHQAYVHKLVTGRRDSFETLRQYEGLTGYPNRAESEHDFVENSHASTSLSYALGMAIAKQRVGDDSYTVAVIGDGALTGGMAYEALNHIAVLQPPKLIIVVNDNGRSYAPTVGGIAALGHLRFDPRYEWTKKTIGRILRSIPAIGEGADELAHRLKESIKQLIEPGTVFDALGLKYSGAIDGHDIDLIEETLEHAKSFDEPSVVHIVTEKGSGYEPALNNEEDKLHGVGAFDVESGQPAKSELKLTSVAGQALVHAARDRQDLVAISAAMISPTGLSAMAREFPDRVIDTGIAEQHAVTLAAGLAMTGLRPVVAIYSSFLQRAFDQIVTDVAMHDLPVVFMIDRAGITGPDGSSHHGAFDLSYLRMIPNLTIGAPADAEELCGMLETAWDFDGPIAIRFPKGAAASVPTLPADAPRSGDRRPGAGGRGCASAGSREHGGTGGEGCRDACPARDLVWDRQRSLGQTPRLASGGLGGAVSKGGHPGRQRRGGRVRRSRSRRTFPTRSGRQGLRARSSRPFPAFGIRRRRASRRRTRPGLNCPTDRGDPDGD